MANDIDHPQHLPELDAQWIADPAAPSEGKLPLARRRVRALTASGSQGAAAPNGISFGSDASHTPSAQKFSITPSGVRKPSS